MISTIIHPFFQSQTQIIANRFSGVCEFVALGWFYVLVRPVIAGDCFHAGLIFDQFPLTLDAGHRTEAAGPFFYEQQKDSETTWAMPPLFSHDVNPAIESREDDFLYPILTYERYGTEYRWQLFQLFSCSGGQAAE